MSTKFWATVVDDHFGTNDLTARLGSGWKVTFVLAPFITLEKEGKVERVIARCERVIAKAWDAMKEIPE